MTKLEVAERDLTRIRETLEHIASEEVLNLIDLLELRIEEIRLLEELNYGDR